MSFLNPKHSLSALATTFLLVSVQHIGLCLIISKGKPDNNNILVEARLKQKLGAEEVARAGLDDLSAQAALICSHPGSEPPLNWLLMREMLDMREIYGRDPDQWAPELQFWKDVLQKEFKDDPAQNAANPVRQVLEFELAREYLKKEKDVPGSCHWASERGSSLVIRNHDTVFEKIREALPAHLKSGKKDQWNPPPVLAHVNEFFFVNFDSVRDTARPVMELRTLIEYAVAMAAMGGRAEEVKTHLHTVCMNVSSDMAADFTYETFTSGKEDDVATRIDYIMYAMFV